MKTIPFDEVIDQLPNEELEKAIAAYVEPMSAIMPEKRLRRNVPKVVTGILGQQTPVVTGIARGSGSVGEKEIWAMANRVYRLLKNDRYETQALYEGLYEMGQRTVEEENPEYLVVAIDPVNFEKPYSKKLEGVSTVHKSLPPNHKGESHLAKGYPAITASVVNTCIPATTYAKWFSYTTEDFLSENMEIKAAIDQTCSRYDDSKILFAGDAGLDDQKIFRWIDEVNQFFVIRACHLDRLVEVYNERMDTWEREHLQDLVDTVPFKTTYKALFHQAGKTRLVNIQLDWFKVRLPDDHLELWVLVADSVDENLSLVLLTNLPLIHLKIVKQVYEDWRLRTRIEHGYRFDQDQGLDVEDMRVQKIDRMQRLFAFVLAAAQFVFSLIQHWPPCAILWFRQLGGKLGLVSDRDGPYLVLRGISAVFQTVATLNFVANYPFPFEVL